jgi:hypothetical protein
VEVAACAEAEQRAGSALDDPEATALAFGEGRDREIGTGRDQRPQVADEIGIAEKHRAARSRLLCERQGLSFAATWKPEDLRTRALRGGRCPVAGAVVRDDHFRLRELLA